MVELPQSMRERQPQFPTAIPIPAQDSHSGLTSASIFPRPQTLKLNPDSLAESGLVTRSTSPYRLATLVTRPMQKESTRCLQPSTPLNPQDVCSTASTLLQAALPISSQSTPTASPNASARFVLEPPPLGRKLAVRRALNFIAPPSPRSQSRKGVWRQRRPVPGRRRRGNRNQRRRRVT